MELPLGKYCLKTSLALAQGNGLAPSGNKPLPKPVLIKILDAMWHHKYVLLHHTSGRNTEPNFLSHGTP